MNINKVKNNSHINSQAKIKPNSGKEASFQKILGANKDKEINLDKIFEEASQKHGIPKKLLQAVAKVESNFNPKAVSKAGASGVMQLMPATAKGLGVTDVFDAKQNINGGAKYLSSLYKKYDRDLDLTLAGYNAGPGNVSKYGGVPPFKETQNYIVKVKEALAGEVGQLHFARSQPPSGTNPIITQQPQTKSEATSELIDLLNEQRIIDLQKATAEMIRLKLLEEDQ